jgi:hypothetical protein
LFLAPRPSISKRQIHFLRSVFIPDPSSRTMLRIAVIATLFCVAVAANVLPISTPLSGLSVSFSKNLKSDEVCKMCIQESVVMCAALQPSFCPVVHSRHTLL